MKRLATTTLAASLALAVVHNADAAEQARAAAAANRTVTVDAPDLFRVRESNVEPRFTSLLGVEVYGNRGKRIGEIEDFVLAKDGQIYAIIETAEGPIEELVQIGDDEVVVAPLRELRNTVWQNGVVAQD